MQRTVILLPAVQEVIGSAPRSANLDSERIVFVRIGHGPRQTCQEAHVPVPVVAVEARRPRAAHQLVFADPVQPVRVRPVHRRAHHLVHHLSVARRVQRIDQIRRRLIETGARETDKVTLRFHQSIAAIRC